MTHTIAAKTRTLLAALLGVAALTAAVPARADHFIAMTRGTNFSGFGAAGVLVPLDLTGATSSPAFFVAAGSRFIVSYTAECANNAAGVGSWVDVDIRAINTATGAVTVLPPTNSGGDAFCTSNNVAGYDGWAMSAVNAVATNLPQGNYRIQVLARTVGGGLGWLGDSSLIVWR
ncbi:hypothetical protein [Azohydromonas aeria]|uniref:hypothetical protein n=1 Tax=Azohydromonas aeria TaxID=2590212 RepID=UPI0012F833FF|nr:hypothetical protein [Azohydromonas aeria]